MVDAPTHTVAAVLREPATLVRALAGAGMQVRVPDTVGRLLVPGDEVEVRFSFGLWAVPMSLRVVRASANGVRAVLVRGPWRELHVEASLVEIGARTELVVEVRASAPFGLVGKAVETAIHGGVRRALVSAVRVVGSVAERWAGRRVVVGAAIVHNGRLLAQQRRFPAADAGRWELPGGRVEPGESEMDAVIRECEEELGVDVVTDRGMEEVPAVTGDAMVQAGRQPSEGSGCTSRVGTDVPLDPDSVLRIHRARLLDAAEDPRPVEHRRLRWVEAADLGALDWLEADRVLVHALRRMLH